MRTAFINTLLKMAKKDRRIMLLTGDLGYSVFEQYIKDLPRQYINMGVSEQNMAGVAAGMAMEEKIPFMYSIIPFTTMRNFEQIRNDICYQNLNVKIVGVGSGFSYGPYGHTHHGLEDIGILRTLANLKIFSPGDVREVKSVVEEAMKINGPVYIRLGRISESPYVHEKRYAFSAGKGIIVQEGLDCTIFSTGTMLYSGLLVARQLRKKGIKARLISMHTIKPLDVNIILDSARKTKGLFTLEEHSIIGGLGSAVAEVLAENNTNVIFKRIGVPDHFTKAIGSQEYMRRTNGLSVDQVTETINEHIKA